MIDRFIIRCCEIIDNFFDGLFSMLVKSKKKKNINVDSPDNRMNYPKE